MQGWREPPAPAIPFSGRAFDREPHLDEVAFEKRPPGGMGRKFHQLPSLSSSSAHSKVERFASRTQPALTSRSAWHSRMCATCSKRDEGRRVGVCGACGACACGAGGAGGAVRHGAAHAVRAARYLFCAGRVSNLSRRTDLDVVLLLHSICAARRALGKVGVIGRVLELELCRV